MKYAIGTNYQYLNHKGETVIAKMVESEEFNGQECVKIEGTINGEALKTVAVYREHVENAFNRCGAKIYENQEA